MLECDKGLDSCWQCEEGSLGLGMRGDPVGVLKVGSLHRRVWPQERARPVTEDPHRRQEWGVRTLGRRLPLSLALGKYPIKESLNLHLSLLICKMGTKT